MATSTMNGVIGHLRRAALLGEGGGLTDRQLLESFLAAVPSPPVDGGLREAAFEALVRRHGPMVLGVCRRILSNTQDAEDAFQATFLVLARKATSIIPRDLVGNWLYGVAYRTALKAKALSTRRRLRERQVKAMPELASASADVSRDLTGDCALLDRELERLPHKYRVPVVLCELEGRPRAEVARHLGIPAGTLSSRLATARKLLATRLARRGVTLSAGPLALALTQGSASAAVPASLVGPTVTGATLVAWGLPSTGVISTKVVVLAEAILKTMFLAKLKVVSGWLLALGLIAAGAGIVASQTPAADRQHSRTPRLQQNADTNPAFVLHQPDPNTDARKDDEDRIQQKQNDNGRKNEKDLQKKQETTMTMMTTTRSTRVLSKCSTFQTTASS